MGMILDGIELPVCCGEGFRIYPYNGDVIITCDGTPKFAGTNIPYHNKCNKSKRLNTLKDGVLWEDCDYCGGDLYEDTKKSTSELPGDFENLTVCEGCWEKHYTELEAESFEAEECNTEGCENEAGYYDKAKTRPIEEGICIPCFMRPSDPEAATERRMMRRHSSESKKMNPLEKAGISGVASGATIEGLETLMAAESFKGEGTLEPCPHDAGIDSEEVSWLGEGDGVVHITGRCRDCSAEGEGYVQIEFEDGERWKDEMAAEEELSEEQLRDYFARLKDKNPKLAKEIEYSVKNEDELPTEEIEKAGFDEDKIEAWVDLVGVEDDNLQPYESCSNCEGEGYVLTSYTSATRFDPADGDGEDCGECGGTGMIDPADYMDKEGQYYAETFDDMKIKYDNRDRTFFIKSVDYDTDGEIENDKLPQEFTIKIPSDYHYFDENADEGDITDVLNEWISTETGFSTKGIVWIEEENNSWRKNAEEKSITPYLLGVGIVGILGYAITRKL